MLEAIPAIAGVLTSLIDRVFPDPVADAQAKTQLINAVTSLNSQEITASAQTISADSRSESWLARSWRPITMLVFLGFVVSYWFGYMPPHATEAIIMKLFDLLQWGLGGYMVGRSAEKITNSIVGGLSNTD